MRPLDPRLLRHSRAARAQLAVTALAGLVLTGLVIAQASLLAHVLAAAAPGTGPAQLRGTLAALFTVLLARAAVGYASEVAALRAAATVKSSLRRELATHALRLGPAWLTGERPGEITTLATAGLDALDPYFARFLPQLVLAVAVPVAVVARIAAADWLSGLIVAVTLPLVPVFGALAGAQARARAQRQWLLLARLGGHFLDVVEGLPTLKIFRRATAQEQVIARVTDSHRRATMDTLRLAFTSALVLELAAALATALVAVEVGLRLLGGHLGYQTALLVLLLTPEAYVPLRAVGAQFHASMEGVAAAGHAFRILGEGPAHAPGQAGSTPVACPSLASATIVLDTAGVTYLGRAAPALAGLSLVIRPGELIAVTGPSGAGKSTLLALLLRFIAPTRGTIRVVPGPGAGPAVPAGTGLDLAGLDLAAWRQQVAWVPQRPHLFAATLADNIALGAPGVPRDTIVEAARLSGVAEFAAALPDGYETRLGDGGRPLSAGQRQRIALARAFLRDAPLLLLDEPAAHLDPVTARRVAGAARNLMAGRTVILVSHGPAWAGIADRTIRLDHGHLVPGPQPLTPAPS